MKKSIIITAIVLILLIVSVIIVALLNKESNMGIDMSSQIQSSIPKSESSQANDEPSQSLETPMLVNELDDEKGLIFLGVPYDKIIEILDENGIGHSKMEDFGSYVVDFRWNDGDFLILFDVENDVVNGIEVGGPSPVQATETQKGLNVGDTYEKMVELYGDDYTTDTIRFLDDEIYTLYNFQMGDHYFEVTFLFDIVTSWKIGSETSPAELSPIAITIGQGETFYLGQTYKDVNAKLLEHRIDDIYEIEITNDPDEWDWGDTIIGTNLVSFTINETVYSIIVYSPSGIPTAEGLMTGDDIEKMKKLYGSNYTTYHDLDNCTVYEYTKDDYYLQVYIGSEDNRVRDWGISIYEYDK